MAISPKKVCLFCEHRLSGSRGKCASLVEFRKNSEVVLECLLCRISVIFALPGTSLVGPACEEEEPDEEPDEEAEEGAEDVK